MEMQPENKYAGITVNERLYVNGLLDKFYSVEIDKMLKFSCLFTLK